MLHLTSLSIKSQLKVLNESEVKLRLKCNINKKTLEDFAVCIKSRFKNYPEHSSASRFFHTRSQFK